MIGLLVASVLVNAGLAALWLRERKRKRVPAPVVRPEEFRPEETETIPVCVAMDGPAGYLANVQTGKRIQFTGVTAWGMKAIPQAGVAQIDMTGIPCFSVGERNGDGTE